MPGQRTNSDGFNPDEKVRETKILHGGITTYSDHSRVELFYDICAFGKKVVPHGKRWTAKEWGFYWDARSRQLAGGTDRSLNDVVQAVIRTPVGPRQV